MTETAIAADIEDQKHPGKLEDIFRRPALFSLCLLLLIGGAILRSAITTRLDGFTMDEAYHIAAGVSYVRNDDFRINPEHPPLVKLWVGSFISATGFHLDPVRKFADKPDERTFAEDDVYLHNDFESVQRRARIAMFTLNGLLLAGLTFALRRAFGPVAALATLVFLAIDPTVAAHLPVVMTDLPVSLLTATAVVLATLAFRSWRWADLAACSVALGLTLATKHSAPIFFIVLIVTGAICAVCLPRSRFPTPTWRTRSAHLLKLLATAVFAVVILWAFYGFRFTEAHAPQEVFNLPLAEKIADLHSPFYRAVLSDMAATHVVPRAYIWGFADTLRAGFQLRAHPVSAFGRAFGRNGPRYFFPGMIALKLPLGLGALVLVGLVLLAMRRLPPGWGFALAIVLVAALAFLAVLSSGATSGGIRHALPVVILLSIFGGCATYLGLVSQRRSFQAAVVVALVAAAVSALPVMRPWEYFNELIGGTKNGYLYFNDEGVDCWQRSKELAAYYHQVIEPTGEKPLLAYPVGESEGKARGLDWPGRLSDPSRILQGSPIILLDAASLSPRSYWNYEAMRKRTPSQRFGNLLVFRGPCNGCGALLSLGLFYGSLGKMFAEKPDLQAAESMLKLSIALDPTTPYFVYLQLGNLYLRQGAREKALTAYQEAARRATIDVAEQRLIEEQIKRLNADPRANVPELRNPGME